jgi:hypothetical protein
VTTYSVLDAKSRTTVLASWPGLLSDVSIKVTTLDDGALAADLASILASLSEGAWYAAAWLDTWDATVEYLSGLDRWLRQAELTGHPPAIDLTGCRHEDVESAFDLRDVVEKDLSGTVRHLSHPQRLGVADELAAEVDAMHRTLASLAVGEEPEDNSRGWQLLDVTRSVHYGLAPYLPEGAAGWVATLFEDAPLTFKWQARGHLLRIEQLAAACVTVGGRASTESSPLQAHCVFPQRDGTSRVIYAEPTSSERSSVGPYLMGGPMVLRVYESDAPQDPVRVPVDPYDTQALVAALGDWVDAVPMRS